MSDANCGEVRSPALPGICLPVFVRIDVDGYELFPGRNGNGLHHVFKPGVTVVAGINGIGKTTLLNVMLRLLVGPFNPEKVTPSEVGAKSHELVRWKTKDFFRSRVGDEAASAVATADFVIGKHKLTVKRNLSDLSLVALIYDTQELEPNEAEYERVVKEASNCSSRYDFDFLVRYLVFFLEQRVPLFWNERGQIEAFRILLCESQLANELSSKQDEIQQKDSQYRNLHWHAKQRRNALTQHRFNQSQANATSARIAALQEQFRGHAVSDRGLIDAINETAGEQSSLKTKILLTKIELEESQRKYEGLQQEYLISAFPKMDESVRYMFSNLLSENGCIACGSKSSHGHERMQRLLSKHDCPVCESSPTEQERQGTATPPNTNELTIAAKEMLRLQKSVTELNKAEALSGNQLRQLAVERKLNQAAWNSVREELTRLNVQLPIEPDTIKALQAQVDSDTADLNDKNAELNRLYVEYEELLTEIRVRVDSISESVQQYFSQYAQSFLAEKCYLGLSSYKEKLGQLKKFDYPCFNVYMTSATSPNRETERDGQEDVSESQREFIDLAFRMALISAVTPADTRAMLIIETPEASLDAYFVDQAGALLREFGALSEEGNIVIVSSNLNRQNMISALLGFTESEEQWPEVEEVNARVINMLKECAPNAALRDRGTLYEETLSEATMGRISARAN